MAGERINLASLDLDTQGLIKAAMDSRKAIQQLRDEQKDLKLTGEENSAQFIRNEVEIKRLSQAYNQQSAAIRSQVTEAGKLSSIEEAITNAMERQSVTVDEARAQNRELIKLRNGVNATTEEGKRLIDEMNARIDENTDFIKENTSAYEQQKMAIGGYKDQIVDAFQEINLFNGGLSGFIMRSQEAGGTGTLLTNSFKGIIAGIGGMTKASLAFLATPLGAFLGALALTIGAVVGAFKFMKSSMNSTEEGSARLAKVTGAVRGIFEGLWKVIKPLGEWMGAVFIATVETLGIALEKVMEGIARALDFLGFDETAADLRGFTETVKASSQASADLAKAEIELEKAQRKSRLTQLEYQKQAEKLRQQRDDESKSIEERIALNNQLGVVLKKQLADEMAIAQEALRVAELRIKAEGKTKEALDAQSAALTEIADIQERITSQESEQLANLNSLRKEAAEKEKERIRQMQEARQKALETYAEKLNLELELFETLQDKKNKSLDEQFAYAEEVLNRQLEINQAEYNASEKTANDKLQLEIANNEALNTYRDAQHDLVVANAERELKLFMDLNKSKLDSNKFLNDEMLKQELERMNNTAQAQKDHQQVLFDNEKISQEELNAALLEIDNSNYTAQQELIKQRETAETERKLLDLENKKAAGQLAFEEQMELDLERLEIQRQQEIEAAEKTGADITLIKDKYAKAAKDIELAKEMVIRQQYADTLGQASELLGKKTALGKAASIAEALINTYNGVTQVWASDSILPEPLATVAKGVSTGVVLASGLKAVSSMKQTNVPKAEKGALFSIGGKRHSAGGTMFTGADGTQFEAEQGELIGVMNRNAARHFMAFNNAFPAGSGISPSNFFASGGIVNRQPAVQSLNIDDLAAKIAEANASIPAPVVAVQDIVTEGNSYVQVRNGASF